MMRLILITGGARSGKSAYAEHRATKETGRVSYVATATVTDDDMAKRITRHRSLRPEHWETIEDPEGAPALRVARYDVIILDCVTMMLAHAIRGSAARTRESVDAATVKAVESLLQAMAVRDGTLLVVTNEVGMSIHPATPLGLWFQDAMGRVNQRLAQAASEVVLLVCGIPVAIKAH
jgi:adenosylcobinamide kinase/adenosylcobinamide-phosphate guanylyltransferase